jgi:hypothetical protein
MVINIIYYKETIDNWGRTESSMKGDIIFNVLNNVEDWTDDMEFEDENGKFYNIDELAGKEVDVPEIGIFTVPTE